MGILKVKSWHIACGLLFVGLVGCSSPEVRDYENTTPQFDIQSYFAGQTWASGMVQDFSGEVTRRFTVSIEGHTDAKGHFIMDEHFQYANGETSQRVWTFKPVDEHCFEGSAADVIGTAYACQYGHAVHMNYDLSVELDKGDYWTFAIEDWLYLQPDGTVLNRSTMRKWGFSVGSITISFSKQAPRTAGSE
ncbi:hypothetical protein BFW38_07310 [Terasakiispira papahanaumokuakeensis]|uniref:DUF3833 domain-containing protein n=1 Tax=Terasakiispira papahanaumokuakeensis TaxID=197479 RepID=A0A1E2V9Q7_9GAMM|nr:hypothetical protein BFW38_07310 [Terasakiispira papahanaumokuakeensis]